MKSPVLEAQAIRKTFREGAETVEVLRSATLALYPGEVVALEGPSGSGKSTLLCILGCVLTPTAGTLRIGGDTIAPDTDLARVRRERLGFVFQQFNLLPPLSALDNVAYPLRLKGMSKDRARSEARATLELVGLGDRVTYLPRDLSGGQKQRVAIARALVTQPDVLLADEPTANLDAAVGRVVLEHFAKLAREAERALLIVTHDPKVRTICDRVLHIESGELTEEAVAAPPHGSSAPRSPSW
jgi:putative ABC transport system ATP-binding protein